LTPNLEISNLTQRREDHNGFARRDLRAFALSREVIARYGGLEVATTIRMACVMLLIVSCFTGCESSTSSRQPPETSKRSKQVSAVGYPLAFFARQLVDDSIDVQAIVPNGGPLDSWRPSREQILSMQQSDVIFVNGSAAPFAVWLPHVTLPESRICTTANDGLKLADLISVNDIRIVHSHGPEGEHSHPTMVAYTWLDPEMAARQVTVMARRLVGAYPDLKNSIGQAEAQLIAELKELSQLLPKVKTTGSTKLNVLTFSPDLKFLTRAAGLNDVHLDIRKLTSKDEAEEQIKTKLAMLTPRPEFLLCDRQPAPEIRSAAEALDLQIIKLNRVAVQPTDGDYFSMMRENISQLNRIFDDTGNPDDGGSPSLEQN
jgi:zinc transport system substrate-binding protein